MGKKIPFDLAMELAAKSSEREESIYAPQNKFGYKININHPQIRPLYKRYQEKVGERILSDKQRHHFEMLIFQMMERKRNEQGNTGGEADS